MTRLVPLVAALLALALPGVAAADVRVDTTVDGNDQDCGTSGDCTLREAIFVAGTSQRVILPAGTYTLTDGAGPLTLAGTRIVGDGARTTIIDVPGRNYRIFEVSGTGNEVSGVTLMRGNGTGFVGTAGGAIIVQGAFAPAALTLTDSTVRDNSAQGGGGIAVGSGGSLTLVRSTVSGNTATAASAAAPGGGIAVASGTVSLVNSTISGNSATGAGGGVHLNAGTLTAQNSTIAGNTAPTHDGLYREPTGSTVTLNSTIVTGAADRSACGGPAPAGANNLADDSSCGFSIADARLGALADNGGPTNTHALGAGSAAIDAGGAGCPATDQRGTGRVGTCDIGAFEYVPPPPPPPPGDELPPPVAGKNVNAIPTRGTVRVTLPGRRRFRVLAEGEQIPVGTTIDTLKGRVSITAAGGQTATFYAGIFRLRQTSGARPLTTLVLVEKLRCPKAGSASIAAKRKKKRRLWGDGSGRFRTEGNYSSATVRGTKWLVEDRCASTLTRVVRGRVSVRDFVKKQTKIVRAGKRYIARRR